jgi:hypothetical protein
VQLVNLQNENKSLKLDQEQNHTKISQKNEEIDQLLVICRALKEQLQFQVELDRTKSTMGSIHGMNQPAIHTSKKSNYEELTAQHSIASQQVGSKKVTDKTWTKVSHPIPEPEMKSMLPEVVSSRPIAASGGELSMPEQRSDTQDTPKSQPPTSPSRIQAGTHEKSGLKRAPSFKRLSQTLPIVPEVDTATRDTKDSMPPPERTSETKLSKVTRSMSPEFRDFFRRSQELRSRTSSSSSIASGKLTSATNVHTRDNGENKGSILSVAKAEISILDDKPTFLQQDVQQAKKMLDSLDNQIQDLEHLFQ